MSVLDRINSPAQLRELPAEQLPVLAQEIREELIKTISELGGHLASSLGAVELCLALHYVFDAPRDLLLWDMGYQAFTHKLITGRRKRFNTLKQFGGLSGFNNKDESPYDHFITGHGGTVLSTALGMAMARDQAGADRHVVAVIGDASLGEGMALEALNHIGHLQPNIMIVLNDNKMSISKPVGGLSRYLNRIITSPRYNRLRDDVDRLMRRMPAGSKMVRISHRLEESLKGFLVPGRVFLDLGFRYVGPIQGHSFPDLLLTLRNAKRLKGPILLHVVTTKGKGYRFAEQDPERFHKTEPFDLHTGHPKVAAAAAEKARRPGRTNGRLAQSFSEAFSDELVRLGESNRKLFAITAAMPEGTGVSSFARRYPDRCIDVGMAEQHAVGLAAGLAAGGMRPVVAVYSTFLQRAYDQIMHEMSLQRLPVVLAIDRAGLVGEDGVTHHGVFDLSYLRPLPHMSVLSPKDPEELRAMLRWALEQPGPVALRYSRGGITCGEPLGKPAKVVSGRAELLRDGRDVALLALGSLVYPALKVADALEREGLSAMVVNARFVKPLDEAMVRQAARVGRIVTLEEGQVAGGFGGAVSEMLDSLKLTVPQWRVGLPDRYIEHGKRSELLRQCRLDPESLAEDVLNWVRSSGTASREPDEARWFTEAAS